MVSFFTSSLFLTLSWTFGELISVFISRWVLYKLLRKEGFFQKGFLVICGIIYVLSIWLHSGGKGIFVGWLDDYSKLGWIYPFLLWDYFFILWAGIEAIILFYVFWIYLLIKESLTGGVGKSQNFLITNRLFINVGFLFFLIVLYITYHYYAVAVHSEYGLDNFQLRNILIFYRRIMGVFFVAFEGTIALLIFKVLFLLKRTRNRGIAYG